MDSSWLGRRGFFQGSPGEDSKQRASGSEECDGSDEHGRPRSLVRKKSLMGVWIPAESPLQFLPLTLGNSPYSLFDLVWKGQGCGN